MKIAKAENMPVATNEDRYAPIVWLFDSRMRLYSNKSSASNVLAAKRHFIKFVGAQYGDCSAAKLLETVFDEFTHVRFAAYVEDLNVSSSHSNGLISSCRVALSYALDLKAFPWVRSFSWAALQTAVRETNARAPYSENETNQIKSAIEDSVRFSLGLLKPYACKNVGASCSGRGRSRGLGLEENMIWYFENVLNCQPITQKSNGAEEHGRFLAAATNQHGGLHEMYRRWGISAMVDQFVVLPLYYKLLMLTGMNTESAASLKVDSFVERHPLTNQAYIEYFKPRSGGDKALHTGLLNRDITRLTGKQSGQIKALWDAIIYLTAPIRMDALGDIKHQLIIWQSRSTRSHGQVVSLKNHLAVMKFNRSFAERYELEADDGTSMLFTSSRFRPSLVSDMVKQGADLDIIQSILGHKSVLTTISYLDSHDFAPAARREVKRSIETIFENSREMEKTPKPIATDRKSEGVFQTATALCKNVFQPPENLRKGMGLTEGQACTNFNMCLRCSNVIIMKDHLPKLAALKNSYEVALTSGVERSTHVHAVRQTLSVLNNILDPELSEFSAEDIENALAFPEDEGMIDPIAYRAVQS